MKKTSSFILLFVCCMVSLWGKDKMNYSAFQNVQLSAEASIARCFGQDSLGLIWIGTNKGLYSFDGYAVQPHYENGGISNVQIHCIEVYEGNTLFLGTDEGLLIYDCRSDNYVKPSVPFPRDIRSLASYGGKLWVGTLNGLYSYDIRKVISGAEKNVISTSYLKGLMVYSIIKYKNSVWAGTTNGLFRLDAASGEFENINSNSSRFFVNALLPDQDNDCIWVGGAFGIFKLNTATNISQRIGDLHSIKTLTSDCDGNIIAGTDNGLYVVKGENTEHYMHDSREAASLSNNIIWSAFRDSAGNIWLGTDNGVSEVPKERSCEFRTTFSLTGTGYRTSFFTIYKDSRGFLWLGGNNGIIRYKADQEGGSESLWYREGGTYHVSHNRIRDIYEDSGGNLWLTTDNGLQLYDYGSRQFSRHIVVDSIGRMRSGWAYKILEDGSNRYWIATWSGIFVADKQEVIRNPIARSSMSFSTADGLEGNFIDLIVYDKSTRSVWALVHLTGIDRIDCLTGAITKIALKEKTGGKYPSYMMEDSDNSIWVGYRGGVLKINPKTLEMATMEFSGSSNAEVLCMTEANGCIWISTTAGIWVTNKEEMKATHLHMSDKIFTSLFYDKDMKTVYLGSVDGYATAPASIISDKQDNSPIIVSEMLVNDNPYLRNEQKRSVRYSDGFDMDYNQNNIIINFSDLTYSIDDESTFLYRLSSDKEWTTIDNNGRTVSLTNLKPGYYPIYVTRLSRKGVPSDMVKKINIHIRDPWYSSTLADLLYMLIFIAIVYWAINFLKMRNRLKYERIEKENALRQANEKMKFYADISHEFKTPLSLIVAPVSRMMSQAHSPQDKADLDLIHTNAMKINSLIHQAISYYSSGSQSELKLTISELEFVEFAHTIFSSFAESMQDDGKEFIFNSNIDKLYVSIDSAKMESVLDNLISNSCKYTSRGDSIMLSINYMQEERKLEIKVSDSGIGIPKEDLPYIFQRFYKSHTNSKGKEGTGIGLSIVKSYVELHGGNVTAESGEDNGTTFIITLPVEKQESPSGETSTLNGIDDRKGLPVIAIVEDNEAIAKLLCEIFNNDYQCIVAHNGKTGLKLCSELLPDLIIADIMMPVMDGMEMCRRLKQNVSTSIIPIIILTAIENKETELESINIKVDAFISKPFEPDIIVSRAKQLIDKKKELERKIRIETMTEPKKIEAVSYDEKFISKMVKAIEDNISNPDLNVNSLCETIGIPQKQVYRKCKQLLGVTPVDYIKSIRLKKAALLLEQQKFTISEVMYMVGFSNHSYFSKCFMQEFGKTPQQYRKERD